METYKRNIFGLFFLIIMVIILNLYAKRATSSPNLPNEESVLPTLPYEEVSIINL